MDKSAFQRVEELFHEALALPPSLRPSYLEAACGADSALRTAVSDLLGHAQANAATEGFLASPLATLASELRADTLTVVASPEPAGATAPRVQAVPGYEIIEEIGRGGMGVVYKARQTSLKRIVALKTLLGGAAAGPQTLARFRVEADALAKLQHPHIVTIFDIGEHEGTPYFAMEYVPGLSLDRLLRGRHQEIMASARLVETLARTIHAVHGQGIIHRDLKPANVLMTWDIERAHQQAPGKEQKPGKRASLSVALTFPKISDFGLAKDQAASRLTQSGMAMGTPGYMAPEQARPSKDGVGPRADVFALGCILYELLTGRPPFDGESAADLFDQLLRDEPLPPSRLRPRLPRDLATICLKCLEKAPGRRYTSAWELAEDLHRFQAGEPIRARAVSWLGRSWRWCRRRPLVAGLVGVIAALVMVLLVTVVGYELALEASLVQLEAKVEGQRQHFVALNVAVGFKEEEWGDSFKALLRYTEALRFDEGFPGEAAHRARIGALLRHSPRLVDLRLDDEQVLCTSLHGRNGWMACVGPGNVVEVKNAWTGERFGQLLKLGEAPTAGAVSEDGRVIALVTRGGVEVWDVGSGGRRKVGAPEAPVKLATVHSDGRTLVISHKDGTVALWDLTAADPRKVRSFSGPNVRCLASSDNGRWLATAVADEGVKLWDAGAAKIKATLAIAANEMAQAALGSEGNRIALVGKDETLRIWDVEAARWLGKPIQLDGLPKHIAFSPNAEQILALGADQDLRIWDTRTAKRVFHALVPGVSRANFLDERFVMTMHETEGAMVWDTITGRRLTPPLRHGGALVDATVAEDKVIIVSREGSVAVWALRLGVENGKQDDTLEARPAAELVTLAETLSGSYIDERQFWQPLSRQRLASAWKRLGALHK